MRLLIAAALAAATAFPALAQQAEPAPAAEPGLRGDQQAALQPPTGKDAMTALDNIRAETAAIQSLQGLDPAKVQVVEGRGLLQGADLNKFDTALTQKTTEVEDLRKVVDSTPALKSALERANAKVGDVAAIDVQDNGQVVVFTRKG